jgi:hypothetical protein
VLSKVWECRGAQHNMKEEWIKRGEMPSICVCFPGAAVLSEENLEGVLREQASSWR